MYYSTWLSDEEKKIFDKLYEELCEERKKKGLKMIPIKDLLLDHSDELGYFLYWYPDIED